LNREGSGYMRKLMEAEKVIKFLEKFKEEVNEDERLILTQTVDLLVDYYSKEK